MGLQWTVGSQLINQAMVLFFNLILLHWITPAEFGLFAFPYMVFTFFRSFHDLGFSEVFIVQKQWDEKLYSSLFWLIIGLAFCSAFIMILTADQMQVWTGKMGTAEIQMWLGLGIIMGSAHAGFDLIFRKQLLFENLFWIEFWANLVSGLLSVWLAFRGVGLYALLAKTLVYVALLSILSLLVCKVKPHFSFSLHHIKSNLPFASANLGDQLIQFFFKNADTFLLSRYAPTVNLGMYYRAFRLLVFPVQQVGASLSKVILPVFVSADLDDKQLAAAYQKLLISAATLALPLLTLVPLVAEDAITLFFRSEWQGLAPLFSIMTLMALAQGSFALANPIFYIKRKVNHLFWFSLVSRSISVAMLIWAIYQKCSIEIIALYFSASAFAFVLPFQWMIVRLLRINSLALMKPLSRILFTCLAMFASVIVLRYFSEDWHVGIRLMINTAIALCIALLFLYHQIRDLGLAFVGSNSPSKSDHR